MQEAERKPAESAPRSGAGLSEEFSLLTVEQQREIVARIREYAEANDKIVPLEEMLTRREFREEAATLARQAGLEMIELARAVNPDRYPAFSARSAYCRIDRYLAQTGVVDIRVQAYRRVEFTHRLLVAPFRVTVLEGAVDVERDGVIFRLDPDLSAEIAGSGSVTLRAAARTRWVYVDHPLTSWIRQNRVRRP